MTTITIFFEPLDVLFTRDHRPFDMGSHSRANSQFPAPTVIAGAIRTALLEARNIDLRSVPKPLPQTALLGDQDRGGEAMTIIGPFLAEKVARKINPLFPRPWDTHLCPAQSPNRIVPVFQQLRKVPENTALFGIEGKMDLRTIFWSPPQDATMQTASAQRSEELVPHQSDRVPSAVISSWLGDTATEVEIPNEGISFEARLGLARDPSRRSAAEALLYNITVLRFAEHWGLAAQLTVDGPAAYSDEICRLDGVTVCIGGDGHRARLHIAEGGIVPSSSQPHPIERWARLYLISPLPLEGRRLSEILSKNGFVLRAIVTGRPQAIGGFNLAAGQPRPLVSALPAGTVIAVERATDAPATAGLIHLLDRAPSTERLDRHLGFGAALIAPTDEPRALEENT